MLALAGCPNPEFHLDKQARRAIAQKAASEPPALRELAASCALETEALQEAVLPVELWEDLPLAGENWATCEGSS